MTSESGSKAECKEPTLMTLSDPDQLCDIDLAKCDVRLQAMRILCYGILHPNLIGGEYDCERKVPLIVDCRSRLKHAGELHDEVRHIVVGVSYVPRNHPRV